MFVNSMTNCPVYKSIPYLILTAWCHAQNCQVLVQLLGIPSHRNVLQTPNEGGGRNVRLPVWAKEKLIHLYLWSVGISYKNNLQVAE